MERSKDQFLKNLDVHALLGQDEKEADIPKDLHVTRQFSAVS